MTQRGYTWTEQYRHECEVRYVAAMPTRQQRADYLDAIEQRKGGKPRADALRRDLRALWQARRAPLPPAGEPRAASVVAVHSGVNGQAEATPPGLGSFLGHPHGGDSDPVTCVDSGVAA